MTGTLSPSPLAQAPSTSSAFNEAGIAVLDLLEASRDARIRLLRKTNDLVDESIFKNATYARHIVLDEILTTVEKFGTRAFVPVIVESRMKALGQTYDPKIDWPLNTLARYTHWVQQARAKDIPWIEQNFLHGLREAITDGMKTGIRSVSAAAVSPALLSTISTELLEQHAMVGPWIVNIDSFDSVTATIAVEHLTIRIPLRNTKMLYIAELRTWVLENEFEAFCNTVITAAQNEIDAIDAEARARRQPQRHKISAIKRLLATRRDKIT